MSLFHLSEWYSARFSGASSMVIAQLIDDRDQLIVGSLEGTLTIIDPGGNVERRYTMATAAELDLKSAVLQVAVGRFLTSFDQQLIAALHPNTIAYFRLTSNDSESYFLERVFEHRITGDPSFNMCQGHFGSSHIEQLCVQSVNCRLCVFEGENRVMNYQIPDAIFPGPIQYTAISDSILFAAGSYLTSARYASLTACATHNESSLPPSGASAVRPNITKKLHLDWTVNMGDTPLEISVINIASIQPSVVVLCKRSVFCLTHGGCIRYVIRLQCVAMCMTINHTNSDKDTEIQICVGLSSKTLIFYHDSKVVWSAQLSFSPIYVNIASFTESLRCLLTLLSADGQVFVGYLGVQPSLSRMPITESRYIDFERRRQELRQFEEIIWRAGRENLNETDEAPFQLHVNVVMDTKSMAYDVNTENVPSATVLIDVAGLRGQADVLFQSDIFAHKTNFSLTSGDTGSISISTFCKNKPTLDLRCQIVVLTNTAETLMHELFLPLCLVCHQVAVQRAATYKLSVDSSEACLGLSQIFEEFELENDASLGLQPYFSDAIVSIFTSAKTNRYRIQSNSMDFLYVVLSELVRRLRTKQPGVRLNCPIPFYMVTNALTAYLETENRQANMERNVSRISVQMRQAETVLLNKLKSDREPFASHLSALINYTYREMMNALDELSEMESHMRSARSKNSLRALLNLTNMLLELSSGMHLPFDGLIIDSTDMKLGALLKRFLQPDAIEPTDDDHVTTNVEEITRLFTEYCEQSSAAGDHSMGPNRLRDLPEEEDQDKAESPRLNAAPNDEFLELKSGSLPVQPALSDIQ